MHVLPVAAHREADFTPERKVVPPLHDTVARFQIFAPVQQPV